MLRMCFQIIALKSGRAGSEGCVPTKKGRLIVFGDCTLHHYAGKPKMPPLINIFGILAIGFWQLETLFGLRVY